MTNAQNSALAARLTADLTASARQLLRAAGLPSGGSTRTAPAPKPGGLPPVSNGLALRALNRAPIGSEHVIADATGRKTTWKVIDHPVLTPAMGAGCGRSSTASSTRRQRSASRRSAAQ